MKRDTIVSAYEAITPTDKKLRFERDVAFLQQTGVNYFLTLMGPEARRCIKVLQWEAKSPQSRMDKRRDDFHEKAFARHGRRVGSSEHCWLRAIHWQG